MEADVGDLARGLGENHGERVAVALRQTHAMTAVTLGTDITTGDEIAMTPKDRGLGTYVIGLTGTGKSTLLLNMIVQDIRAGHGLTLLDPHGDLAPQVLHYIPASRQNDVIYLDFGNTKIVPGFDLFYAPPSTDDADIVEQQGSVVDAFQKILGSQSWGPRIEEVLLHIANTFRQNPGFTLPEMRYLLTSQAFRDHCIEQLDPFSPEALFWQEFGEKTPTQQENFRQSTVSKINQFVGNPTLTHITGQPRKVIDFDAVLRDRKILIVRMPQGALKKATRFIGFLFADRLLKAAFKRFDIPESQRTFHAIYCDEFQYFATDDFQEFIAGGRKYGIGLLLAHQWRDQLDREMQSATVAARSKIVFQVNSEDAPAFSRGFAAPMFPAVEEAETIPANPWDVLVRKGHTDPQVVKLVGAVQRALSRVEHRLKGIWHEQNLLSSQLKPSVLDPLDQYLNGYLYRRLIGQEGGVTWYALEMHLKRRQWEVDEDFRLGLANPLLDLADRLVETRMAYKTREPGRRATEISQGLSSLPSYHAKCKVMQNGAAVECTLKTHPPFPTEASGIAQAIIADSQRRYCTPVAEIDRAMKKFQRELQELEAETDADELYDAPPPARKRGTHTRLPRKTPAGLPQDDFFGDKTPQR